MNHFLPLPVWVNIAAFLLPVDPTYQHQPTSIHKGKPILQTATLQWFAWCDATQYRKPTRSPIAVSYTHLTLPTKRIV